MLLSGDITQMQDLTTAFTTAATDIEGLVTRISSTVHGTTWTGPAADRFRTQWDGEFRPMLSRLQETLVENGAVVQARRTALEQASA